MKEVVLKALLNALLAPFPEKFLCRLDGLFSYVLQWIQPRYFVKSQRLSAGTLLISSVDKDDNKKKNESSTLTNLIWIDLVRFDSSIFLKFTFTISNSK
jgi:hypothetical protein